MVSPIPKPDIDRALERCAAEPVHIPGVIQPNGALIAVENETRLITHVSANLEHVTGLVPKDVLSQNIYDVFPSGLRHDLVNNLLPQFLMQDTRQIDPFSLNNRVLSAGASQANEATIFEFEAADEAQNLSGAAVRQLAFLTSQLHEIDDIETLFEKSVKLLQALTGYQRVMIYAFDGEGHGSILAEALLGQADSFLGLNFPAWDIPAQAREIMRRTPFRYIGDVVADPVPILAASSDIAPLDMTHSHLRGVSKVHLQYLRNMGSAATFTLNVVVEDKLWGMISLHHPSSRVPGQSIREVCRNFVRFFGLKLATLLQDERLRRLQKAEDLRQDLAAMASQQDVEQRFSTALLQNLCTAMQSDGAVLVTEGVVQTCGMVPEPKDIRHLQDYARARSEMMYSAAMLFDHPDLAQRLGGIFSGLHLTPMQRSDFVAFFRLDRERNVAWAGAPEKDIDGIGVDARLRPRGSFEAYKETVRGTSEPWSDKEHQIARDIRSILISSERMALIKQTRLQQKALTDELNHRVRNILALIRTLSHQSRDTAESVEDYAQTLERRIEAVAMAHALAMGGEEVSIKDIIEREAAPFNETTLRVEVMGSDIRLRAEAAPLFALVVHELMTNAALYGALSSSEGNILVGLKMEGGALHLEWREQDGPQITQPTRLGFGTALLTKAVPAELGGEVTQGYTETGLKLDLTLPARVLSVQRSEAQHTDGPVKPVADDRPLRKRIGINCLLVEDSFVVSMDTLRLMNELGLMVVQTAMTSKDALQKISDEQPGFAVLDVNLSQGDTSFAIARKLQELGVPFVFLTGYGAEGVPEQEFPEVTVLEKPLRRAELAQVLDRLGV